MNKDSTTSTDGEFGEIDFGDEEFIKRLPNEIKNNPWKLYEARRKNLEKRRWCDV